jgi:hypothetical protein
MLYFAYSNNSSFLSSEKNATKLHIYNFSKGNTQSWSISYNSKMRLILSKAASKVIHCEYFYSYWLSTI